MKFPLSWLHDHLQTDAALSAITDTLSSIGLEVEGVEDRAAALAPFVTARVIEAVPHPNADRLRVCRLDVGGGQEVSVVCGAPNARTGMHAVFAPPGAFIPGSGITLKLGEIRGVASAGMLVSAREMGLGQDHEGIVELPEGAPVGVGYAVWAGLDDPVIDISVTPNRGDALSVRGVARDLAAAGVGVLKPWAPGAITPGFASPIVWRNEAPADCPWVLGRIIRGVRNGASPEWLQRRLLAIGLRPISALVDVTNFLTIDSGRPLHVFDADRIEGTALTLRRGAGETFRALNGRDIEAGSPDLVIADARGAVSLAGIMGGERTGSTETTTSVFVECALFDPVRIALSGRRLGLASDARQRFERGIDPSLLPAGLDAATRLILDLCGGEASEVVSAGREPSWQRRATLRFARLADFGGADLPADEAVGILERLGFATVHRDAAQVTVAVPPWRNDVASPSGLDQPSDLEPERARFAAEGAAAMEPECDLIEEVLRIHGLDRIAPVSLPVLGAVPAPSLTPRQSRTALARRVLASRGLAECVTYSFGAHEAASWFGGAPHALRLNNPIASDLDQMRPTPLLGLAQAAVRNADRGAEEIGLFEVGPGYAAEGQDLAAAGLRAGASTRHWRGRARPLDALDAKEDAWALLAALGVPMEALSVTPDAPAHYHPGRSGQIRQGPKTILARFGELHPALLAWLKLDAPVLAFEVFPDRIAEPKRRRRQAPELSAFQPVRRDFAFVMKVDIVAETALRAARSADRALIARVGLFDVFEGGTVPAGYKSLGIEVVFQPRERTMTEQDIEVASAKVVEFVTKATGAQLR